MFDEFGAAVQWTSRNPVTLEEEVRQSSIELDRLVVEHMRYNRTSDSLEREKLAKRIRRRWCELVDHAIGYAIPSHPRCIFEFRP